MRKIVSGLAAVGLLAGGLTAIAAWPAAGGNGAEHILHVVKVVEGDAGDAEFEGMIDCTPGDLDGGGPLTPGAPITLSRDANISDADCTVTEPVDGGADQVIFTCEVNFGDDGTCSGDNSVSYLVEEAGEATITITNVFDPEPAAQAVEAEPTFTG